MISEVGGSKKLPIQAAMRPINTPARSTPVALPRVIQPDRHTLTRRRLTLTAVEAAFGVACVALVVWVAVTLLSVRSPIELVVSVGFALVTFATLRSEVRRAKRPYSVVITLLEDRVRYGNATTKLQEVEYVLIKRIEVKDHRESGWSEPRLEIIGYVWKDRIIIPSAALETDDLRTIIRTIAARQPSVQLNERAAQLARLPA